VIFEKEPTMSYCLAMSDSIIRVCRQDKVKTEAPRQQATEEVLFQT
jgi:hypothetical protein